MLLPPPLFAKMMMLLSSSWWPCWMPPQALLPPVTFCDSRHCTAPARLRTKTSCDTSEYVYTSSFCE